jgi:hypothetical protein
MRILERLVYLREVTADYTYYGIASPWLQVRQHMLTQQMVTVLPCRNCCARGIVYVYVRCWVEELCRAACSLTRVVFLCFCMQAVPGFPFVCHTAKQLVKLLLCACCCAGQGATHAAVLPAA